MDARERLRQYLEQRRELGETELVLDSLSVEEAMRILGAGKAHAPSRPPRPSTSGADEERAVQPPVLRSPSDAASTNDDIGGDWRAALRASGAAPDQVQPERSGKPTAEGSEAPSEPPPEPAGGPPPNAAPLPEPTTDDGSPIAPPGLIVGAASHELLGGGMGHLDSLGAIADAVAGCTRCPLYATATKPVPGEGNPQAELVVVGEAPGAMEDQEGKPFVGAAGQLLTKILAAIDLRREDVFICNVLKHRPPGNRNPLPDEIAACSPYLVRQIELIRPKVLLALGAFAAQTLLGTTLSISRLRGQIHRYHGVPLIVTYHPAALLRNPSWKRPTWQDVQLARRVLDRARAGA